VGFRLLLLVVFSLAVGGFFESGANRNNGADWTDRAGMTGDVTVS
jgi:hypothetical protein